MRGLPRLQTHASMALVHASPETPWRAPMPEANDAELERSIVHSAIQSRFTGVSIAHTFAAFLE
jgi:hypothetical protein